MPVEENLETVFVYGTLLADEVTKLVLDRVPQSEPGIPGACQGPQWALFDLHHFNHKTLRSNFARLQTICHQGPHVPSLGQSNCPGLN